MAKQFAPRTLEDRVKVCIKRMRDCLDRLSRHPDRGTKAFVFEQPDGRLMVTSLEHQIKGRLIGAYTQVDWQQLVEDVYAP